MASKSLWDTTVAYGGVQQPTVVRNTLQCTTGDYSTVRWPVVAHSSLQWSEGTCSTPSSDITLKIYRTVSVIKKRAGKIMQIRLSGTLAVSLPVLRTENSAAIPRIYE